MILVILGISIFVLPLVGLALLLPGAERISRRWGD